MAREVVDERYVDINSFLFGRYELAFTIYKETTLNLYDIEITNSFNNYVCSINEFCSHEAALKHIDKFVNTITENDDNMFVDLI